MREDFKIRRAVLDDAEIIAKYNILMAEETESKRLDFNVIFDGVKNLMKMSNYGFYVVAEVNGEIAGTLMITYEWSDWRNGLFYWIQSVYVHPDFRRKGVFKGMYKYVEKIAADDQKSCGLRLYVESGNHQARKTYKNLGMKETSYRLYEYIF